MQTVEVLRSTDNRHLTSVYSLGNGRVFCLAEPTRKGSLITQFSEKGEVLDQVHMKNASPVETLSGYLGHDFEISIKEGGEYGGISVKAKCTNCNVGVVKRELDSKKPQEIGDVPVVPLFFCSSCKKRYYSMSERYLRKLVEGNLVLFEEKDLTEKAKDGDAFINTLREYMIRIFASKKISKLALEK